MPRVIDGDVKQIFETTIDTTPFITAANLVVTNQLASAGMSDSELTEIERWLSAHFACARDPREVDKTAGEASSTFEQGTLGAALKSTRYGQMVLLLDRSGTLAASGMKRGRIQVAPRRENTTDDDDD